jgi:3-oxoacyl-[acyl-carrier-protein] synthase II
MLTTTTGRPPVITGWAAVSPLGVGRPAFTAGLRAGSAVFPPSAAPSTAVEQAYLVPGFDVRTALGRKGTRSMDRATGLAVTAVGQLLADDRIANSGRAGESTGLVLGTSTGSAQSIMDFTRDSLVGAKPFFVDPAKFPNTVMNCAAGQCAIWHQLKGPNITIAGGRVTGLHALQYALRLRKSGQADSVLCGAVEEFSDARAWLERHSRGQEAGQTVLGEGCAVLLLGPADDGDGGLAEVLGLAFGVWHAEDGIAAALSTCVRRVLRAAGVDPAAVWAASVSGMPGALAAHEETALADVFGDRQLERIRCAELIGETSAASAAFQMAAVLATADGDQDAAGRIAVVTSIDHDGGIGCALMRLL